MTDKELSVTLREMAREQTKMPMCADGYNDWPDEQNMEELLERYIKFFDFNTANDFPSKDFLKRNVPIEDLHRHHIYIDEKIDIANATKGPWIFLGECEGTITFEGFSTATIYIRHQCHIRIIAKDYAKIFPRCYDTSECECEHYDRSVCVLLDKRE